MEVCAGESVSICELTTANLGTTTAEKVGLIIIKLGSSSSSKSSVTRAQQPGPGKRPDGRRSVGVKLLLLLLLTVADVLFFSLGISLFLTSAKVNHKRSPTRSSGGN